MYFDMCISVFTANIVAWEAQICLVITLVRNKLETAALNLD